MSSSVKAANHLGLNYEQNNLETLRLTNFGQIENVFTVGQNLVVENSREILKVKTIDCRSSCWTRSTLADDQVKTWSKAKVRAYSDSLKCLGKMSASDSEANARWSSLVNEFKMYCALDEFLGIDGEAIKFESNIFPEIHNIANS